MVTRCTALAVLLGGGLAAVSGAVSQDGGKDRFVLQVTHLV